MGHREIQEWKKHCRQYNIIYGEYNKRLAQNRKNLKGWNKVEIAFDSILKSKERKIDKAWELRELAMQESCRRLKNLWENQGVKK